MNSGGAFRLLAVCRQQILRFQLNFPKNNYAKKDTGSVSMIGGALKKKKLGKIGPVVEKKVLPVETDAEKLVKFVCGSNIYTTGEDVQVKPDNEYPEWLWSVRTGPPPPLEELDPNSKVYWKRIRKLALRQNNKLAQLKKF
ncbi:large ribosomal subunit protein mL54 [Tenebrio molitor]|uniref:large ribosomal subunit protein mL54 n=1 Tax=Tenebrio molitor TaxID=7067 RepID=UPI0036247FD9